MIRATLPSSLISRPPSFRTMWLPSTSVSRPLAKNVFRALSGVATIGSPRRLNEVFMMTGTPVCPRNW